MKKTRRNIFFVLVMGFMVVAIGGLTYLFATVGTLPDVAREVPLYFVPTQAPLGFTPIVPFAQVDERVIAYVQNSVSVYGETQLQVLPNVQSVGAYLPRTGNTQFEFIPPTPFPTPLPYPTTPPLPLPAIAGQALPTLTSADGRTLPYAGDGCAPSGLPIDGILTQRFHAYHSGIDVGVPLGTPVLATQSGTIVWAQWSDVGYGYLVIIQNGRFITYYAHNTSFNVVAGQQVGKGSIIAWSGSTGNSSGPHVHYETRIDDIPVDPLTFESRGYASC
jgi:murein DD-endopeptidase MepM/ murein hydrolase activator NlpD